MFFSLFNIWDIFQKYINMILAKKLDIFIIMYLDNILIYIKDFGKVHVKAIYWVLNQL